MHGPRYISWPQGDSEHSMYKDGFKHGMSQYTYNTGEMENCSYKNGRLHGKCEITDMNKKLVRVCIYNQNSKVECTDYSKSGLQLDKMTEKVFGIVKEAGTLIQETGQYITGQEK